MSDHTDPDRWTEAEALARNTQVTDDRCHGRCTDLRYWFTYETRGLLDPDEAHEVLDMVLNRLEGDGRLK